MKKQSLLFSPKKTYELRVYANRMATTFANFGCSKPKCYKDTYALNVLQFIDKSASEAKETTDSSNDMDSATESTAT